MKTSFFLGLRLLFGDFVLEFRLLIGDFLLLSADFGLHKLAHMLDLLKRLFSSPLGVFCAVVRGFDVS